MEKLGIAFCLDHPALITQLKRQNVVYKEAVEFFTDQASMLRAWHSGVYDRAVISVADLQVTELSDFVELLRDRAMTQLVVVLSNEDNSSNRSMMRYCLAHNIDFVRHDHDEGTVAEQIFNLLVEVEQTEGQSNSRVVVFAGTTPNIGTTVVAYTTALLLAQQTNHSVAYVCLNLKSSKIHTYIGLDQPVITLDTFRADIKSRALTVDKIRQYSIPCKGTENLSIIVGNMAREQAEFYSVDDIQHVLDTIASAFELCIVEVNAYWDNAATICCLMGAHSKIIVSTDRLSHFQEDTARWLKNVAPVYKLDLSSFDLFITQYDDNKQHSRISFKHIRKVTGMSIVGKLRNIERLDELLNEGRIDDIVAHEPQVSKDLKGLLKMLTTLYRLNIKHVPPIQKWSLWQQLVKGRS